jgi:Transcriptional regulators containing a DNA-binding HTH domain and an aminotransferase domain (MocR family) and their eukaryotic orthologs
MTEIICSQVNDTRWHTPGGSFYPNGNKENTFRIKFSNMPEDRNRIGIQTIGEVIITL